MQPGSKVSGGAAAIQNDKCLLEQALSLIDSLPLSARVVRRRILR